MPAKRSPSVQPDSKPPIPQSTVTLAVFLLAVCAVFGIVCLLLPDLTGVVGSTLHDILRGFFGRAAYGLPILLISGQDDPVGDGGKGVQVIYNRMEKTGMENVTLKLFPGARHDLLHEEASGAEDARKCIADWLDVQSAHRLYEETARS